MILIFTTIAHEIKKQTIGLSLWFAAILVGVTIPASSVYAEVYSFVTLEYPPIEFQKDNGEASGVAVEIVRQIMKNLGHEANIMVLPWTRALKMVRTGKVDAIFTAYKNPERETFLDYSNEVLISQTVCFYKKKGTAFQYDGTIETIKGKRIGVVSTISYGQVFDGYRPLLEIDRANRLKQSLTKLIKGRVDLIPSDYYVAEYTIKKNGLADEIERLPIMIESVPSFVAFSKKMNLLQLRDQFDEQISVMKKDGTYDAILNKYGLELYE